MTDMERIKAAIEKRAKRGMGPGALFRPMSAETLKILSGCDDPLLRRGVQQELQRRKDRNARKKDRIELQYHVRDAHKLTAVRNSATRRVRRAIQIVQSAGLTVN